MKKILQILLTSLQEQTGKGSAKRFTLYAVVLMLGFIVVAKTTDVNATVMAGVLSGLIGGLTGVTAYHSLKDKDK